MRIRIEESLSEIPNKRYAQTRVYWWHDPLDKDKVWHTCPAAFVAGDLPTTPELCYLGYLVEQGLTIKEYTDDSMTSFTERPLWPCVEVRYAFWDPTNLGVGSRGILLDKEVAGVLHNQREDYEALR